MIERCLGKHLEPDIGQEGAAIGASWFGKMAVTLDERS